MTIPPNKQRYVFELCLGKLSSRVPQLRAAVTQCDKTAVQNLARELRNTVEMLGLPKLFQLSQDIEYVHDDADPSDWLRNCHRFCDLLERVQDSLQQRLSQN